MKRVPGYNDIRPFGYQDPKKENKVFFWMLIILLVSLVGFVISFYLA
jgi:hypothetical protein